MLARVLYIREGGLTVDVSVGEILYLVLVVAIGWWAFDVLARHDDRRG